MKGNIQIYHDSKTLETKNKLEFRRRKSFTKSSKKYHKRLDERRFFKFDIYGKVFSVTTKTIKRSLATFDWIVPMTFFIPTIIGEFIYRKLGFKEFLRIALNNKPRKF